MKLVEKPSVVEAVGTKPKLIEEFFGRVNSADEKISIAKMKSPEGWTEPFQKPEFDEYTIVINGKLKCEINNKEYIIEKGQGILIESGERVRYSTPFSGGAEYIAVCLPAFSMNTVNREE